MKSSIVSLALAWLFAGAAVFAQIDRPCYIDTVAGGGTLPAGEGGPALEAELLDPAFVVQNSNGLIYFADRGHFRIRRITADGRIETVAGNGNIGTGGDGGPATEASLGIVRSMSFAPDGSLYWLESNHYYDSPLLRRLRPDGVIETVAGARSAAFSGDGGPAEEAGLYGAAGIAVGPDGSIYLANQRAHLVRRIDPSGRIETIAGNRDPPTQPGATMGFPAGDGGPAVDATLDRPDQVLVAKDSTIYVRETFGARVRRITPDGLIETYLRSSVTTISADGALRMESPYFEINSSRLGIDSQGRLYWQTSDGTVRRISLDGRFETVWTGESDIVLAFFGVTGDGRLWDADLGRLYELAGADEFRPFAGVSRLEYSGGDGAPAKGSFLYPEFTQVTPDGHIYAYDVASRRIRTIQDGVIRNVAGNGGKGLPIDGAIATQSPLDVLGIVQALAAGKEGTVFFGERYARVWRVAPEGVLTAYAGISRTWCDRSRGNCGDGGPANQALLGSINSLAVDSQGALYIDHDQLNQDRRTERVLRRIGPDGVIETLELPFGPDQREELPLSVDSEGRLLLTTSRGPYIYALEADGTYSRVPRRYPISSTRAMDAHGNQYVPLSQITRYAPDGSRTTIVPQRLDASVAAGDGGPAYSATLGSIDALSVDRDNNLYIVDKQARRIRRIAHADACVQVGLGPAAIVHAASGDLKLAPGTIFSIYASNLGPEEPIAAAPDVAGRFPTELAGVEVKFGGVPAPLLFVSANQVNGVTPAAGAWLETGRPAFDGRLRPQTDVLVSIEHLGVAFDPQAVRISPSAPALFSQGGGLAAALNQNGSLNTADNPAAPGSIIVLFGTGEGAVDAPVADGQVITGSPLPRPVLPVSVTVGGEPAEILYAGSAPSLVYGVLQVNARISASLQARGMVRAVLKIGDYDNAAQSINVAVGP